MKRDVMCVVLENKDGTTCGVEVARAVLNKLQSTRREGTQPRVTTDQPPTNDHDKYSTEQDTTTDGLSA